MHRGRPARPRADRRAAETANVVFMAGRKFGSSGHEDLTWAMNAHVPALVAEAFAGSRIVAYSTGCVYPYVNVHHGGATEATPAMPPPGTYANSCVAREGMFQYFSRTRGTPGRIIRLNYAIDMRYGVLHDVATRVLAGEPINLTDGPRQRDLAGRRQRDGAARARSLHRAVEPAQCQRPGDRERALAGGIVRPAPGQDAGLHRRRSAPKAGWSTPPRRCGCSAIRACRSLTHDRLDRGLGRRAACRASARTLITIRAMAPSELAVRRQAVADAGGTGRRRRAGARSRLEPACRRLAHLPRARHASTPPAPAKAASSRPRRRCPMASDSPGSAWCW